MATESTAIAQQPVLLPPPQSTGNPQQDLPLIVNWMYLLYQILQVNGSFVTQASQVNAQTFDPNTLPDPNGTNLATAQDTANKAYALAENAVSTANAATTTANAAQAQVTALAAIINKWVVGTITISASATGGTHTFATAQADTSYIVLPICVSTTGTPDPGSNTIEGITKGTSNFTINLAAAPNTGNSVTFDFIVMRFT